MRFVIKNYIKGSRRENLYATLTYSIKDISEAKEKINELVRIIRTVDQKTKGAGKTIKLLTALFDVRKKEENEELVVKIFLPNEKKKIKADCIAKISWCLDTKEEPEIDFTNSTCDISGLYFSDPQEIWGLYFSFKKATYNINNIPLDKFEEYAKEIPNSWFDEDTGIVFSAKFERKENKDDRINTTGSKTK